jgi:hypothetical protein
MAKTKPEDLKAPPVMAAMDEEIISLAALEAKLPEMPAAFIDWGVAEDIANSMLQYAKLTEYLRASRHTGDSAKIDQYTRDLALTRTAILSLQDTHPGAVPLAKLWAAAKAKEYADKVKAAS